MMQCFVNNNICENPYLFLAIIEPSVSRIPRDQSNLNSDRLQDTDYGTSVSIN